MTLWPFASQKPKVAALLGCQHPLIFAGGLCPQVPPVCEWLFGPFWSVPSPWDFASKTALFYSTSAVTVQMQALSFQLFLELCCVNTYTYCNLIIVLNHALCLHVLMIDCSAWTENIRNNKINKRTHTQQYYIHTGM